MTKISTAIKTMLADRRAKRELCKQAKADGKRVKVLGHWRGEFSGEVSEVHETYAVIGGQEVTYASAGFEVQG